MPELPEVETVRRGLAPIFEGSSIFEVELRRADLRFPFPPNFRARLKGRRVATLRRRAKYLVAELDNGEALIMHLGMSGSFRIDAAPPGDFHFSRSKHPAHDHVVFDFESGARVTYNDPRRFGFMLLLAAKEILAHPLFAKLGMEPLDPAMSADTLARILQGRATPLKSALLDQKNIAGLGNIYVCEALHRARTLAAAHRRKSRRLRKASERAGAPLDLDKGGFDRGDRGGRLLAARPPTDGWVSRLLPT